MSRRSSPEMAEITFALKWQGRSTGFAQSAELPQSTARLKSVTIAMALAIHFQDLIDRGIARDFADVARLAGMSRERVSQISKLLWLAPDIQAELLAGRLTTSETSARLLSCQPVWTDQRYLLQPDLPTGAGS